MTPGGKAITLTSNPKSSNNSRLNQGIHMLLRLFIKYINASLDKALAEDMADFGIRTWSVKRSA